jgi:rhodanese-related sulfurtransferase
VDISVEDLARWRRERKAFVLLDVREPEELAIARIDGSVCIPMREIARRLDELDPESTIAVICHVGARSERVAAFLRTRGFEHAVNVDGGIDAYAERIEPGLSRY